MELRLKKGWWWRGHNNHTLNVCGSHHCFFLATSQLTLALFVVFIYQSVIITVSLTVVRQHVVSFAAFL